MSFLHLSAPSACCRVASSAAQYSECHSFFAAARQTLPKLRQRRQHMGSKVHGTAAQNPRRNTLAAILTLMLHQHNVQDFSNRRERACYQLYQFISAIWLMEPLFDSMNDSRCVDSCWPGGAAAEARRTSLTKKDWRSVHNMERERGSVCVCVCIRRDEIWVWKYSKGTMSKLWNCESLISTTV